MLIVKLLLVMLLTVTLFPLVSGPEKPLSTERSVDLAIREGALGSEFAARVSRIENLYVSKIQKAGVPLDLYTFSDYKGGYTVLVEGTRLVLLCYGFGGGYAHNFQIIEEHGIKVLTYQYEIGSGISITYDGKYVLNSQQ
jgi:hypothetical protein